MGAEHGDLTQGADERTQGLQSARAALLEHLWELLRSTGLGPTQFAHAFGFPKSTASRYFSGQRLPSWQFLEALLTAAETSAGAPLTAEVRQQTFQRHRNVVNLGDYPDLRKVYELLDQVQRLTAELSRVYFTIRGLEIHLAQLQQASQYQEEALERERLRRVRLEANRLRAQRDALRAEIALREEDLPTRARQVYDVDQQVPPREPVPPWWNEPPGVPPMPSPLPPVPAPPSRHRPRPATLLLTLALVISAALIGYLLPRLLPSGTPTGAGSPPPASSSLPAPSRSPETAASNTPVTTAIPAATPSKSWTVKYNTHITLPPASMQCGLSAANLATPQVNDGGDLLNLPDIEIRSECPFNSPSYAVAQFEGPEHGSSSAQEPGPDQCQSDAGKNGISQTMNLKDFSVGSAYCFVTSDETVVWLKVTATTGSDQTGRVLQAIAWTQN